MLVPTTEQMGPEEVEAIGEAMGHPVRSQIACALEEEPGLTARQLADRIGEPLRRVRYQLQVLRDAGLAEISGRHDRRGAIEHRYAMSREMILGDAEYDALSASARGRVGLTVLRLIAADIAAASSQGILGARRGHAEIRFIGEVDGGGWDDLASIHWRFLRETRRVYDAARRRIAQGAEAPIPVTVALLLFERGGLGPPPAERPPAAYFTVAEVRAMVGRDPALVRLAFLIGDNPGLTVREMAERVGETPRRVRYRLDLLRGAGLVAVSGERPRRGGIEHRYAMVRRVVFSDEDLDPMEGSTKEQLALAVFGNIAGDAVAAAREGTFGVRPGHAQVRCIGEVDELGWTALAAMSVRYLAAVQEVLAGPVRRLSDDGREGAAITSGLLLLERPQPASA